MEQVQLQSRYELAIIGCGPAGMAAALNAKIRNRDFILLGTESGSAKLGKAPQIENYLGLPQISGVELNRHFLSHLESRQISIVNQRVSAVYAGSRFTLMLTDQVLEAEAVILATGVSMQKPFPGEAQLLGRGVGYCATCDGPLYKDKRVAIISYTPEGEHEADFMATLGAQVVYIPFYKDVGSLDPRVEVKRTMIKGIHGQDRVESLELAGETLLLDGVFVLREFLPAEQLVSGLEMYEQVIRVDNSLKTNIAGLFAAGDCVGPPYQILKAVGQGSAAALNAITYLDERKKNDGEGKN
ncbi:MAG: NAD(P)/FAD-dependent oxidoreductase [Peptococcaceae bacterium]|jgi:thioredoxin reductase (NADPH)|nr:NAD(P)/FAD-dependent oxidoreductase [Peptococcaceae bacterium]